LLSKSSLLRILATYAESDLRDAVAMPDRAIWNDNDFVKFVKPNTYILHNQESFADVEEVVSFARQMSTTVEFVSDKQAAKIKKQLNACIRSGDAIIAQTFEDFDCDPNLIGLWALVKSIKEDCLFICRNSGPDAYLGYDRIDAEGYVMTNEFGCSNWSIVRSSATQTSIKGGFRKYNSREGNLAPFFILIFFLFQGCFSGDRWHQQGDLAPLWIVPLL
jgi:hypothetical protein